MALTEQEKQLIDFMAGRFIDTSETDPLQTKANIETAYNHATEVMKGRHFVLQGTEGSTLTDEQLEVVDKWASQWYVDGKFSTGTPAWNKAVDVITETQSYIDGIKVIREKEFAELEVWIADNSNPSTPPVAGLGGGSAENVDFVAALKDVALQLHASRTENKTLKNRVDELEARVAELEKA